MTTADAIAESITRSSIVHLPWSQSVADELAVECDDSADTAEVVEFWGTDDDGAEWRVHLDL